MARKSEAGFWLVQWPEAQWLAWHSWLNNELGKPAHHHRLPVPGEWPPETDAAVIFVVDYFQRLRDEITRESKGRETFAALRPNPRPWRRWTAAECAARVARETGSGDDVITPQNASEIIARVYAEAEKRSGARPFWITKRHPQLDPGALREPPKSEQPVVMSELEKSRAAMLKEALEHKLPPPT